VLQNKNKPKKGQLPKDMMDEGRYLAAETVDDVWICYPWEATYDSILPQTKKALLIRFASVILKNMIVWQLRRAESENFSGHVDQLIECN